MKKTEWLRQVVQKAIERLGPKLDQDFADHLYIIDTLNVEINLKESELDQLETVLRKIILDEIQNVIETQQQAEIEHKTQEKAQKTVNEKRRELLSHFLLTGRMPWWAGSSDLFPEIEAFLEKISYEEWRNFIIPLVQEKQMVVQRLVAQFPSRTVHELIKRSATDAAVAKEILALLNEITRFIKKQSLSESSAQDLTTTLLEKALAGILYDQSQTELNKCMMGILIDKISLPNSSIYTEWKQWLQESEIPKKDAWIQQFDDIKDESTLVEDIMELEEVTRTDKTEWDEATGTSVLNSGIVILHPFLESLFGNLALIEDGQFSNDVSRERAVCLVHFLATGSDHFPEHELLMPKFLCGWPMEDPINRFLPISDYEKSECIAVLNSAIEHWEALKQTSIEGLRTNFLQREGILKHEEFGWSLYVEQETHDILLEKLPWSLSVVTFRWLNEMLTVHWQ